MICCLQGEKRESNSVLIGISKNLEYQCLNTGEVSQPKLGEQILSSSTFLLHSDPLLLDDVH